MREIEPERFAEAHQTASGALHLRDPSEEDAWITSDEVREVRR